MFSIVIRFDAATQALLTRLVDALEGKQQAQVDALVERMGSTRNRLAAVVAATSHPQTATKATKEN